MIVTVANPPFKVDIPFSNVGSLAEHDERVSLGTTILAFVYADGIVMAADTRSTSSFVVNYATKKLNPLTDKIWLARTGGVATSQAVIQFGRRYLKLQEVTTGQEATPRTAASLVRHIVYENKPLLQSSFIIAGYNDCGEPEIFRVSSSGVLMSHKAVAMGSGSAFIYSILEDKYEPTMNREQAVEFARRAIELASEFDGASGSGIRFAIITKTGVEEVFIPTEETQLLTPKL